MKDDWSSAIGNSPLTALAPSRLSPDVASVRIEHLKSLQPDIKRQDGITIRQLPRSATLPPRPVYFFCGAATSRSFSVTLLLDLRTVHV